MKEYIRIGLAGILLIMALIIPMEGFIKVAMLLLAYVIVGYDIIFSAIKNIFHGEIFDENFLMGIATIGALALGEYSEAVAIMLLYQIEELFQDIAVGKNRKNIASLMDIKPDSATVIRNGKKENVSPE